MRKSLVFFGILLATTFCAVGCGEKVEMKVVDNTGGVAQPDQDKIRGYLDAAGLKGEIVTITDDGTRWVVDVGAPKAKPGERATPVMPKTYIVEKEGGKVKPLEQM